MIRLALEPTEVAPLPAPHPETLRTEIMAAVPNNRVHPLMARRGAQVSRETFVQPAEIFRSTGMRIKLRYLNIGKSPEPDQICVLQPMQKLPPDLARGRKMLMFASVGLSAGSALLQSRYR